MEQTNKQKDSSIFYLLLSSAIFTAFFILATPCINGSDQFWHYNYVDSILHGNLYSNEIYPGMVFNPQWDGSMAGFFHNTPILYIWSFFAWITGSQFHGAMIANLLCAFISAVCIRGILKKYTAKKMADIGFMLMLFFPLNFFQSIQMLTETSALTFICLALYFFAVPINGRFFGIIFLSLGFRSRENSILLVLLFFYLFLIRGWKQCCQKEKTKRLVSGLLFVIFDCLLEYALTDEVNPAFKRSFMETLTVNLVKIPKDNMALVFLPNIEPLSFGELILGGLQKFLYIWKIQLNCRPSYILFISINFIFAAACILSIMAYRKFHGKASWYNFVYLGVVFVSWLGGAVMFQNQVRYQVIFVPIILGVILHNIFRLELMEKKAFKVLIVLFVFGCIGVSGVLTMKSNMDAKAEYELFTSYQEEITSAIEPDANIVVLDNALVGNAAYPHTVTMIQTKYEYGEAEEEKLLQGTFYSNDYLIKKNQTAVQNNYAEIIDRLYEPYFTGEHLTIYKSKN